MNNRNEMMLAQVVKALFARSGQQTYLRITAAEMAHALTLEVNLEKGDDGSITIKRKLSTTPQGRQ
jgi:hypothetical protein